MNVKDWLRQRIIKFLKLEHLSENPDGERFTFINNNDDIRKLKLHENKMWYYGDGSELLNFYTNAQLYEYNSNPIYNRNKRDYFWALSVDETHIKRVHSGIPHAIVDTLVNAIGTFKYSTQDKKIDDLLDKIIKDNNFYSMINQQEMPLTLVEGYGAFKYSFNKEVSKFPIIEYYDGENVEFIYKNKRLVGIVFIDYYKDDKDNNYVLFEARRIMNGNSIIEYKLFLEKKNDLKPVKLDTLPETSHLPEEGYIIEGFNEILATPTIFFYDTLNQGYGRSIFDGKIDQFDELDQILSQQSQTVRVSTPVEYYDVESLTRSPYGQPKLPSCFNRQFIAKEPMRDGDGNSTSKAIETTQPHLDFNQYNIAYVNVLMNTLTGILAPATMGIDVAKRDNADAQREKEKITLMTRNNIIDKQITIIRDALKKCLYLVEFMETGNITLEEYNIEVRFDEYATPTFNEKLSVLGSAVQNRTMSPERFIEMLYGEELDDETKQKELEYVSKQFELEDMMMQQQLEQAQLGQEDDNQPI